MVNRVYLSFVVSGYSPFKVAQNGFVLFNHHIVTYRNFNSFLIFGNFHKPCKTVIQQLFFTNLMLPKQHSIL